MVYGPKDYRFPHSAILHAIVSLLNREDYALMMF